MKLKKTISVTISILLLITLFAMNVSAASNPYDQYQTLDGVTTVRCTYYAWQQAYDNTGVALPNFGDAKNWYTNAQNAGYSVGTTARAKSIAVWTNSGYGHVGYVVSVNGSTMKVNEGGMTDLDGQAYNGTGIINGSTCNSTVGSNKSIYSSSVLLGFIYLTESEHTHNYTIHEYEAVHPHKYYKKCSCGDYYYTGETATLSNCSYCIPTLTITYNANGGYINDEKEETYYLNNSKTILKYSDNSKYAQNWKYGTSYENGLVNASTFGLLRDGYTFKGWSLSVSGETIYSQTGSRKPEDIYPDLVKGDAAITMYAVWEPNILTIKYHINGGSVNSEKYYSNDNLIYTKSSSLVLEDTWDYNSVHKNGLYNVSTFGLSKPGYSFKGWKVGATGSTIFAQDDETIVPTDLTNKIINGNCTITLYAVWEKNKSFSYYDWTFNVEAFKNAVDSVINGDGTTSDMMIELNKGLIFSETLGLEETMNYPIPTKRVGYKFIEWITILKPDSGYTDSYFVQAQYEPLLYSKGECIYCDVNFDNEVNILDFIRIKKMLAGTAENHISADLDGDDITGATDVSTLRKNLLTPISNKTIYFNANGGTVNETFRIINCGQPLGELPAPTRTGYSFIGWYTNEGTEITPHTLMTSYADINAIAKWSINPYKVSWNAGTGYEITVKRTSSPNANASTDILSSGDTVYFGDVLTISYSANKGYSLKTSGVTSITVKSNVTSSSIYATANANSYTYNIVYKSSNGTNLGSSTVKYKYGTTNTISPKKFTGYQTPATQNIKWNSTSAKTITFTYSPLTVSSSQNLTNGTWAIDGSTNYITYSVKAEYRNRTSNSIQVRIVWTNTLIAYYHYQRGQVFNANIGGKDTGNVTIVPYNTWVNSTSSSRSLSGTSNWITIPVSATQTSISVNTTAYRQHSDGSLVDINESCSATFNIPAF